MCNIDLQNTKGGERIMKLIVDIDNYKLEACKRHVAEHCASWYDDMVVNGVPLPKGKRHRQTDVLDEIRREIEEDIEQVEETVDYDCNGYGKTGVNYLVYLVDVLEVIDKYRKARDKE